MIKVFLLKIFAIYDLLDELPNTFCIHSIRNWTHKISHDEDEVVDVSFHLSYVQYLIQRVTLILMSLAESNIIILCMYDVSGMKIY